MISNPNHDKLRSIMSKDILDKTVLTPRAVEAWHNKCLEFIKSAKIPDPSLIPDEQAVMLEDGRLKLFVEVEGYGRCELVFSREDWGWFS